MIYTYYYDEQYIPAFPVAEIEIRGKGDKIVTATGLVDSGSDATMIPLKYLHEVRARKGGRKRVYVLGNHSYITDSYYVTLQLAGTSVQVVVLGDRLHDQLIIGRDVLNYLVITLNGVAHTVEISS
jgi:predicted aspartyl protease